MKILGLTLVGMYIFNCIIATWVIITVFIPALKKCCAFDSFSKKDQWKIRLQKYPEGIFCAFVPIIHLGLVLWLCIVSIQEYGDMIYSELEKDGRFSHDTIIK